jgi:hypothetical protein
VSAFFFSFIIIVIYLETMSSKPSLVWSHITKTTSDNQINFSCIHCSKGKWHYSLAEWSGSRRSTSLFLRHLKLYHGRKLEEKNGPLDEYLKTGSIYELDGIQEVNQEMMKRAQEDVIIADMLPFTHFDSDAVRRLLKLCFKSSKELPILKASALQSGIKSRVKREKSELFQDIKDNIATKLHLSLDMWSSKNNYSFLLILGHYGDKNFNIKEVMIDFIETTDHSGENLAKLVEGALLDSGLIYHLGCLTMDNAYNNNTLV